MNYVIHRFKLIFLRPLWRIKRLWHIASDWKDLNEILQKENDLNDTLLAVKRNNQHDDVMKLEGQLEMLNWFKEKLNGD
jgi:hypothetical protein